MSIEVTISDPMTLVGQASGTAAIYLRDAVKEIDQQFGEGYAKDHPELIASFIQAAAMDYHSGLMKIAAQDIRDAIGAISIGSRR